MSYIEKFQAMQSAMTGPRAAHIDTTPSIAGTTYQNMRADEIIKKYHNNSEVQSKVYTARAHGTVSPRQLDFSRNIGTAAGNNLNSSYVSYSETLMASGNMSLAS